MSQVTEQSVRFQTALASIKLIQASAVLDLTEDDFDFLTSNKVWIATDRSRARRCVEACVYGTLDFVGYPRFPAPVEFIAAVIAYYVHPVNIQTACLIMEGAEFTENIINCRGFGPLLVDKLCLIFKLAPSVCRMTFPILASLLVRLVVLLPYQLLRLSLATPSRWTPLALSVFLHCVVALLLTLL